MATPTIFDVAHRAGVSKSTVSKVLTDHPHVSAATRARVRAAIAELNYHPNVAARRFQSRTSHLIGLAFPRIGELSVSPAFFSAFLSGAGTVARERHYDLVWLVTLSVDDGHPHAYAQRYLQREVDGMLVANTSEKDPRIAALRQAGCPFVLVGRYSAPDVVTVDVDNVQVGYLATAHLLSLGHRRVALLNGHADLPFCQDRWQGYRQAFAAADLAVDERLVTWTAFSEANGYAMTRQLLGSEHPPTALIWTDPSLQRGGERALELLGVRVPGDVSVVAVVDFAPTGDFPPAVTAVVQPTIQLGHLAAETLLRLIDGAEPNPLRQLLAPHLVPGRGTASGPGEPVAGR